MSLRTLLADVFRGIAHLLDSKGDATEPLNATNDEHELDRQFPSTEAIYAEMLRTMDEGYKIIALNGEKLNPLASFWQITLGNAKALSLEEKIGTLDIGTDADLVVLDAKATPAMRLRMERIETLAEELFLMQTMGDDRTVREAYVAGKPAKSELAS